MKEKTLFCPKNMLLFTEVIGYLAAVFGTFLLLPQVYKTLKTKRVKDISTTMLVVYIINCSLWETYGILLKSMPIIICNLSALCIGIFQLILKVKYKNLELNSNL